MCGGRTAHTLPGTGVAVTDPRTPSGRSYGMDTMARQMAMEAQQAVAAARAAVATVTPSVGTGSVPALALGASASVTVALSPGLGNGQFIAIPTLLGSAGLLGSLVLGGITAKTPNSVTVTVRAPLIAVAAGAQIQVVAFKVV